MCLGSALTEKRHELAEEIPGMQGSAEELFGEGGSVGPELETWTVWGRQEREKEEREWKISSDSEKTSLRIF